MCRISIEVSPRQHQEIKTLATLQGKSICQFMLDSVLSPASAKTPNQETIAAIEAARVGEGTTYENVQAMMDDILGAER